jgi:hypothetical protein
VIRYHHNIHKTLEREVLRALQFRGLETRTVKRFQYNDEVVRWADIVFTTGMGLLLENQGDLCLYDPGVCHVWIKANRTVIMLWGIKS